MSKTASRAIVGYYAGWDLRTDYSSKDIRADLLTHLNYAFGDIDPVSGTLVTSGFPNDLLHFETFRRLKAENPHLKTLISVGGWGRSGGFSRIAATKESREIFAKSCVSFLLEHGFDGVDLDWEYPVSGGEGNYHASPADKENFTLLLAEIRRCLDAQGSLDNRHYLLTIAAAAGKSYLSKIEPQKVASLVDYIFLMTYDIHGYWDPYADFNAPLYTPSEDSPQEKFSVMDSVDCWLSAKVPSSKLVLGMPFYGHFHEGVKPENFGLYSPFSKGRSISFHEVREKFLCDPAFFLHRHPVAKVPWLYGKDTFIGYEDEESIAEKVQAAKDKGLLGVGIWELSEDKDALLLQSAYDTIQK